VPAELVGKHVIAVAACYAGPMEDGARALRPLKSFGQPLLDLCRPKPYLVHQSMFDASFPHGWWYYVRSCDVAELNDDVIDIVAEHGDRIVSPITSVALWQLGGAVGRIGETRPPSTDAAPASRLTSTATARLRTASTPNAIGRAGIGRHWRPITAALM
jgi:hypothetical protein